MSQNCMNGGDASLLESKDSFDFSKILSVSKTPREKLIAARKSPLGPKEENQKAQKLKRRLKLVPNPPQQRNL